MPIQILLEDTNALLFARLVALVADDWSASCETLAHHERRLAAGDLLATAPAAAARPASLGRAVPVDGALTDRRRALTPK